MYENTKYLPVGDCAIVMEFGNEIHPRINKRIREITHLLQKENINGILEWVPTYSSIMLLYDPTVLLYQDLLIVLQDLEKKRNELVLPPPLVTEIPTVYGGKYGPDLSYVATYNGISEDEVITLHSGPEYLIYMLGFTPGFPYLGGMSEKIATPRLSSPRTKIPGGSVGIAASQTGIYPIDSPGGWQLIGRTPLEFFNPDKSEPVLLQAGNYIKFVPVCVEEYLEIEEKIKQGEYMIKVFPLNRDSEED